MKTTCIIQIGENQYTTYIEAIERSLTVDIKDYNIDPLIYGEKVYILIFLLCTVEHNWQLWESLFLNKERNI